MLPMIALPGDIADQLLAANEDVDASGICRCGRRSPQPLGLEVGHVEAPVAEEQVIGVHAAPLVAAMAQDLAGGDRPMAPGPRQAMGEPGAVGVADDAVATRLGRTLPDPAARERIATGAMGDALLDRPRIGAFEPHQRPPPPRPSSGRITTSPTSSWPR